MIQVVHELCGIEDGFITTVHSYTGDQRLHDAPHKDLRRARAAAVSMVPTTTGAAKAITRIFPELDGAWAAVASACPCPMAPSPTSPAREERCTTAEQINARFKELAEGRLKGILRYTEDPIVSVDIVGDPEQLHLRRTAHQRGGQHGEGDGLVR